MTDKRKVYNELGVKPKRAVNIARATGLTPARTVQILNQLGREHKAVYVKGKGWKKGSGVSPSPKPPPSPTPTPPAPSWQLPSPLLLSGVPGDDGGVRDHSGVGTVGLIMVPGVCPLWECYPVNQTAGQHRGLIGQIEGFDQLQVAIDLINAHRRDGDHLAIVGTGNVPAKRMVDMGVNVYFAEMNAQAGWEPYGNWENALSYRANMDGWPHAHPSWGVYGSVGLQQYAEYHAGIYNAQGQVVGYENHPQGLTGYYAIFSIQGMGDTNSWPYFEGR